MPFFLYGNALQETSSCEILPTREEAIESRLNIAMKKFADEGINFTMKNEDDVFVFKIGCEFCPSFNINPCSVNSWEKNVEQHVAPNASSSKKNKKRIKSFF